MNFRILTKMVLRCAANVLYVGRNFKKSDLIQIWTTNRNDPYSKLKSHMLTHFDIIKIDQEWPQCFVVLFQVVLVNKF